MSLVTLLNHLGIAANGASTGDFQSNGSRLTGSGHFEAAAANAATTMANITGCLLQLNLLRILLYHGHDNVVHFTERQDRLWSASKSAVRRADCGTTFGTPYM